jgi:NTP pyrophosphatase (non-canonical NTP hydrolase)
MQFAEYQSRAIQTRQKPKREVPDPVVPFLGLAGEVGELLSEYKKHLRDGEAHVLYRDRVAEELGDLLWYIADLANLYDLELDEIASGNLEKCRLRFSDDASASATPFDASNPEAEQFPRQFDITLRTITVDGKTKMRMLMNGKQLGDDLTDNAYDDDGYRFHDVFHLACVAVLGWSPVIRKLLGRKRKTNDQVDEVEDGGRATAIEEGISALVFSYAQHRNWLMDVEVLDYSLLRTIAGMTEHLEVSSRTARDWERAITAAYAVWRDVKERGGGTVHLDLDYRTLSFVG